MIEYYFPPQGGIGSLRAAKFATYLPEFGWEPVVVAPRRGAFPKDPELSWGTAEVVRTSNIELSRLGRGPSQSGGSSGVSMRVGGIRQGLRDVVRRWLYFPDGQIGWYPSALRAARRVLRERRFDAVFSSSFPITAHLVADRLRSDFGLPWAAEFRDPWTDTRAPTAPWGSAARRLEGRLLSHADVVVTTSQDWATLMTRRGARRTNVVTNGFDPTDLPPLKPPNQLTITYAGTYYPSRQDLSSIWSALAGLRTSQAIRPFKIRILGAGTLTLAEEIRDAGLSDVLDAKGLVGHGQALEITTRSSVLLLAGPTSNAPTEKGCLAAKVFEYLATGLPIVCVSLPGTELASILERHPGCRVVPPGRPDMAADAILRASQEPAQRRDVAAFTRRSLGGQLAQALTNICS
jgi:glycosyltransferase involved in cell wall biosynthesis